MWEIKKPEEKAGAMQKQDIPRISGSLRRKKLAVAVNRNLAFPDVVFLSTLIAKSQLRSLYSYISGCGFYGEE